MEKIFFLWQNYIEKKFILYLKDFGNKIKILNP